MLYARLQFLVADSPVHASLQVQRCISDVIVLTEVRRNLYWRREFLTDHFLPSLFLKQFGERSRNHTRNAGNK